MHVHPPLEVLVQVAPEIVRWIPAQSTFVPERTKHPATMSRRGVPVVVVPSTYVPLALAVKVPVTLKDPEIPTLVQVRGSRPSQDGSTLPFTVRHEDITFQVPTTLPPQAVTSAHDPPVPPPAPVVPPPLELPPVPDGVLVVGLHAPENTPNAIAIARAAD